MEWEYEGFTEGLSLAMGSLCAKNADRSFQMRQNNERKAKPGQLHTKPIVVYTPTSVPSSKLPDAELFMAHMDRRIYTRGKTLLSVRDGVCGTRISR